MTEVSATLPVMVALRQRHAALAERCLGPTGVSSGERAALIADLVQAGAVVPAGVERDGLRNMLFFWCSEQAGHGERDRAASAPMLKPYAGPAASDDPYASAGFNIQIPGGRSSVLAKAFGAPAPPHAGIGLGADRLNAGYDDATAGSNAPERRTMAPILPRPPPADGATVAVAPAEATPDQSALPSAAEARRAIRISAMAREWRLTPADRKRGYLINDAVTLSEAERYSSNDPEIAGFVEASRAALVAVSTKRRFAWITAILALALALSLALGIALYLRQESQRATMAAISDERGKLKAATEGAAIALSAGDVGPLRSLLEATTYVTRADLDRLQLVADTRVGAAPTEVAGPTQASVSASADRSGLLCTGQLWIGTKGRPSRLTGGPALRPGDSATLIEKWPLVDFATKRTLALLRPEVPFTFVAPFDNPDAAEGQIWATVTVPKRYCTRVYIQYAGPADRVAAVQLALRDRGLIVPPAERVSSAEGLTEVRYFWPEDQSAAQDAAQAVRPFAGGAKVGTVSLAKYPRKPGPGTIEVWLDLSRP